MESVRSYHEDRTAEIDTSARWKLGRDQVKKRVLKNTGETHKQIYHLDVRLSKRDVQVLDTSEARSIRVIKPPNIRGIGVAYHKGISRCV